MDDYVARRHLEWHQRGLKDEEVVSYRDPEGFIYVAACEADEWRGNWKIRHHLCDRYSHGEDEATPDGEGQKEGSWAAIEETATDLDVECRADSTSYAYKLDVSWLCCTIKSRLVMVARAGGITFNFR